MSCQKLGSWEKAVKLLYEMEGSGVTVSTSSYNLVISACEKSRQSKVALQVYDHMVQRGCDPDTFTYLSLIRSCVWGSLWGEVKDIIKKVEADVSLYNAAIHGMCLRREFKLAKELYVEMREMGLEPDESLVFLVPNPPSLSLCYRPTDSDKADFPAKKQKHASYHSPPLCSVHSAPQREKEKEKMNSSSKVIMAATMVMVVSLVMVLSLVLVLLAELYCSLLLGRRRRRNHSLTLPTTTITTAATTTTSLAQAISTTNDHPSPSNTHLSTNPLTTGVLQTPKPFLITNKTYLLHHESSSSLPASPSVPIDNDSVDSFIYISNPMYSNDATSKPTTPFETPESSPSRLETGDSSSSSGEEENDVTPTLTPMKDLPEKACSVSLQDNARSLESSASESNNDKDKDGGLSTSSGSPSYTSPSW
ncbi:hypothetical protein N665_0157s0294 [Sinapis alba]|nr:hypothetical protein N665_0157s0294 [Sinapis alba]